jgi:hypothetical protein
MKAPEGIEPHRPGMPWTADELGLPAGYEYSACYWATATDRKRVSIEVSRGGRPLFTVWFVGLIPFTPPAFPGKAMIERVDATRFEDEDEAAREWVPDACELYGGLPVHLDTWNEKLAYYQGRWVNRATGNPVPVESRP